MPKYINVNNIPGYKPVKNVEKDFPNKTSFANHVNNVGNNSNSSPESNILCTDPFIGVNMEEVYHPCQELIEQKAPAVKCNFPAVKVFMALGTIVLIGGSLAYASGAPGAPGAPGAEGAASLKPELLPEAKSLRGARSPRGRIDAPENQDSSKNLLDLGVHRGFSGKMEAKQRLAMKMINEYDKSPHRGEPLPVGRLLFTQKDNKRSIVIGHIIKDIAASYNSFEANISHDNKFLEKTTGSQRELLTKRISLYKKAQQEIDILQATILKITSNMNFSVYKKSKDLITLIDIFCKKHKVRHENVTEFVKIPQNMLNLCQVLEAQLKRLEKFSS